MGGAETYLLASGKVVVTDGAMVITQDYEGTQWEVSFAIDTVTADAAYQGEGHDTDKTCGPGPGSAQLLSVTGDGPDRDADVLTLFWGRFVSVCPHDDAPVFDLIEDFSCDPLVLADPEDGVSRVEFRLGG